MTSAAVPPPRPPRVVIVGAGVAGLVCARELRRRGVEALVLEREREVGGRVRSRVHEGFVLDRGFQVLFTGYPVLGGHLDLPALAPRAFLPGARLPDPAGHGEAGLVGDALRDPALLLPTLRAPQLPLADKLRLLRLRRWVRSRPEAALLAPPYAGRTALDDLRARGFSTEALRRFFVPFYGGILLDRALETRASVLLFTFRMLAAGDTVVPAAGMGAVTRQLAAGLHASRVRTGHLVEAVVAEGGRVRGVRVRPAGGGDAELVEADHVVLATEAPTLARLAATADVALPVPDGALGCTTVHFAAAEPPLPGRAIWLNPDPAAAVAHAVTLSEIAPEYAPAGRHLLSATVVGRDADLPDDVLVARVRADVARLRGAPLPALHLLSVERVPYAQFPQPPGRAPMPGPATGLPGLWVASEALHLSSLEGATRGGRDAARAIVAEGPR